MGSVDAICTWLSDPRAADTEQHDAGSADRRRHEFADDGLICPEKVEAAPSGYYDLILMDIMMPRMDGPKATRRIRQLPDRAKAEIPIIAMTTNVSEKDRSAAREAGMMHVNPDESRHFPNSNERPFFPDEGTPSLKLRDKQTRKVRVLTGKDLFLLGRNSDLDMVFEDRLVSRRHCALSRRRRGRVAAAGVFPVSAQKRPSALRAVQNRYGVFLRRHDFSFMPPLFFPLPGVKSG